MKKGKLSFTIYDITKKYVTMDVFIDYRINNAIHTKYLFTIFDVERKQAEAIARTANMNVNNNNNIISLLDFKKERANGRRDSDIPVPA